jgi:hypothetical protein
MLSLAAGLLTSQRRAKANMNQAWPEGLGAIECALATMAAASEAMNEKETPGILWRDLIYAPCSINRYFFL